MTTDHHRTFVYAGMAGEREYIGGGGLYRRAEGDGEWQSIGETWERVDIGDTPPGRMAQIAIDRANPSHIYCCAMYGQVYGSHDGGQTWQKSQLPVETSRSRRIYAMVCG